MIDLYKIVGLLDSIDRRWNIGKDGYVDYRLQQI